MPIYRFAPKKSWSTCKNTLFIFIFFSPPSTLLRVLYANIDNPGSTVLPRLVLLPHFSPAKAEPASLLGLRWLAGCLSGRWRLSCDGSSNRGLTRVANIVPGDVEEDGLDGDEGLFGRELDNVLEVDAASGELVQTLDQRGRGDGALGQLLLAQIVNVNNGLVAAELAVDEVRELPDGVARDFNVGGRASSARGRLGKLLGGKLATIRGVLDEREGVCDVANDGVRASNGQCPV